MAGWHATIDPVCVLGEGEGAYAVLRICWPVQWGRSEDLAPLPRLVELLDGVVGHVQARGEFQLYNWFWGTERVTVLIGVKVIGQKTRAINALSTNGAKQVNRLGVGEGKVLCRNKSAQMVDDAAAEAEMVELIAEAVVQGLDDPERPASSGTRVLLGEPVYGAWVDRTRMHGAKSTDEDAYTTLHRLRVDPLPHMAHLSPEAYAEHWSAVADEIEAVERAARAAAEAATEAELEALAAFEAAPVRAPFHSPYVGGGAGVAAAMTRYRDRVKGIRKASAAWRAFAAGRRAVPLRYPEGTHCPGALCRALPRALARSGDPPSGAG